MYKIRSLDVIASYLIRYAIKKLNIEVNKMSGVNLHIYSMRSVLFYEAYIGKHADKYLKNSDKRYIYVILSSYLNTYENCCMIMLKHKSIIECSAMYDRVVSYFGKLIENKLTKCDDLGINFAWLYGIICNSDLQLRNDLGINKGLGK